MRQQYVNHWPFEEKGGIAPEDHKISMANSSNLDDIITKVEDIIKSFILTFHLHKQTKFHFFFSILSSELEFL